MSRMPWPKLLIATAIALAGIVIGAGLAMRHYEPQLAAANKQLGEFEHAYLSMAAAASRQNSAIAALRLAADKRKKAAAVVMQQAQRTADQNYQQARVILAQTTPATDRCAAARSAFDDELRAEREQRQ